MRRVLAALVLLLLLVGCGVDAQDRPEGIDIPEPSTTDPPPATDGGSREVTVFFVRGARLEPAERSSARADVTSVLELLVAGPTRGEVIGGLRTALAPQSLTPEPSGTTGPVVTIAVTREFTDVAGGNQLLAVAQVVWTVTQVPGVDLVRVTSDGQPVEVPTDEGLTDQPVGRSDYLSVAPSGAEPPTAAPAPPPPVSTAPSSTDE
ncbi:sporulation and spore germination protein [Blastococcus colisei]|uniref:Sporulation and spore germination protein n=1 Tax=Blastococcus colisei TaxID=1564162 RepID=A0A543PEY9_9ACTN|nr:GerMN domain-containing protein [Blastococcus colisei]TQN42628.1 sporulation and spore germination protein [Blastococcus colisei]